MTVEQFRQLPENETARCELVHGEVIQMAGAHFGHERIKFRLSASIGAYVLSNPIGEVYAETMFDLNEDNSRKPDVSVLFTDRVDKMREDDYPAGAPDIAFEIVSSEKASDLMDKVELYLATGAKTVVVLFPKPQTIHIYRPKQDPHVVREGEFLELPDLLPGFRVAVNWLFGRPA